MNQEIGSMAGAMWRTLHDKGEMSVTALKKSVAAKDTEGPVVDWAIGWLAREGKIAFRKDRNTIKISLRPE
jgi:winged helix-turn-helix protein DUF2582